MFFLSLFHLYIFIRSLLLIQQAELQLKAAIILIIFNFISEFFQPMSQTLDQSMFSVSFHNHVDSNGNGKKDHLISSISQKIYEKHKAVISLKRVQQFTESQLKGKSNIDSTDLTKIENKILQAMQAGAQTNIPLNKRVNGRNSQIMNQPIQGFSTVNMKSPKASTNVNSKSVLDKYPCNLPDKFNTDKKRSLDLIGVDPKQRASANRLPTIKQVLSNQNQNGKSKAQLETIFGLKKNMLDKSLERIETDPGNSNHHITNKLQHQKIDQLNRVNNLIQQRRKTHSVLENTTQLVNVNGRLKALETGSDQKSLSPQAKNPIDRLNNSSLEGGLTNNMNDLTTVLNLSKIAKRQGSLWDAIHEERAAEENKLIELREMKRRQNTLKTAQDNLEFTEKKINLQFKQTLELQDEKKQIQSRMKEHQEQEWNKFTQNKRQQVHLNNVYKKSMDESRNNLMQQRKQMSKDLHQSIRKKEQFEAQRRLDRMRKQRIQTEMAALWLEEKEKKQLEFEVQFQIDKSHGIAHQKNQNLVFETNEKAYTQKMNDKIKKQNSILTNSLSPDNKYKNYAMAQQQKDQELAEYFEREKNKSQKMADIHELNRKKFRKDQSKMLKEVTLKQIDQVHNVLQKQRQNELEEGMKIINQDNKLQKNQEIERKLKKKQGQQQYKKDLITQVYSKVNLMTQENIDDKEFATSKKYGQNGTISQVGSGFKSLSGTVGSPSPLLKRDNNN